MIKIYISKNLDLARNELLKEIGKSKTLPISFSIDDIGWKVYLDSKSLFGEKIQVIFSSDDASTFDNNVLEVFSKSSNDFLFFGKETVAFVKILEKLKAEVISVKDKVQFEKKETPAVFKITNAISAGDKKKVWLNFLESLEMGESAESIHGGLLWFFKNLYLYEQSQKEKFNHGINPYVVSGLKNAQNVIGQNRTKEIYKELTFLLSDSRFKGTDTNVVLENFLLKKIF
ncbi:MAG: hypothetical protein KA007_00950 [Candidatus Pacebacteria bacterium]|nr:hypothetical protein [Candidatus Paceibacterota bacterium]